MKNLKNLNVSIYALLVIGLIAMVSCTKTGPAGAAGATGASGATGATGAAGPDSVQYSPWITLVTEARVFDPYYSDTVLVDTITAPGITSSVLSSGAVIGYLYAATYDPAGDSTIINVDNTNLVEIAQLPEVGKIVLYWFPNDDYTGYQYRYVIIPGNIETTSTSGMRPTSYNPGQLKTMTYPDLDGILKMRTSGNLAPLPFRQ